MAHRLKRRGIERECVVPYLILREYGFGVYGPRKSKSSLSAGIGQHKVYRSHECDGRRADGGGLDLNSSDEGANGSLSDSVRSTVATLDNLITRWVAYDETMQLSVHLFQFRQDDFNWLAQGQGGSYLHVTPCLAI